MDIRVLQYFLAVAREESFTKAAQSLRMTQPPLSRQIKELEEELGKPLFVRGSKRVALTEDGVLLRKRAEELVELMEKTKAELSASDGQASGDIYIGCGETDAVSLVAQTAERRQKQCPRIHYHIYSGDSEIVLEKLDKGLIDFALLVGPVDVSKYDCVRLPVYDTWGVLMRRDSPLAGREAICAGDLWDKPLIVSRKAYASSEIFSWLGREPQKLRVVMTYNLIYNATHFVKAGFGYAITLDKLVNTSGDSPLCFRPLHPPLQAGLCIACKKHQVFSRASQTFLDLLKSQWETEASAL